MNASHSLACDCGKCRYIRWLAEPAQLHRARMELLNQLAVRDIERSLRLGRLVGL